MDTMTPQTLTILAIVAAIALIALAAFLIHRSRQSQRLRERFGSEYDRAVRTHKNRGQAEAELLRREDRVEHLTIVPLTPADAAKRVVQHRAEGHHT